MTEPKMRIRSPEKRSGDVGSVNDLSFRLLFDLCLMPLLEFYTGHRLPERWNVYDVK